jgi:hypothetical protein
MVKAGFDTATTGIGFLQAFRRHKEEPETVLESERVSRVFSTYSEGEIRSASHRIEQCRKRFEREGDGVQRIRCICSVLNDFRTGNGGVLPEIDDWEKYWHQLCGAKASTRSLFPGLSRNTNLHQYIEN